jgi:hypothetical protein
MLVTCLSSQYLLGQGFDSVASRSPGSSVVPGPENKPLDLLVDAASAAESVTSHRNGLTEQRLPWHD